ncbi:MAG: FAD/FMN-containing dehydrogenase [Planctomycetota bacterium]|jgi:FAD/FMN-containing dehydrogenase
MINKELSEIIKGDIQIDGDTLSAYSHDASVLEIRPEMVVFPKDSQDIQDLVQYVSKEKANDPSLSLTVRSAGTCMSGGSINDSIIMDVTRYMHEIFSVSPSEHEHARMLQYHSEEVPFLGEGGYAVTQPGVYYRDFEKRTKEIDFVMPSYTASKDICAVGGMFGNNSGGEKTIKYGKCENYILQTKTVFSDGKEYVVKPLTKSQLDAKIAQKDFEGDLYREVFELIERNEEMIMEAEPNVTKNSAGYYLWNVWDKKRGIFDLNRLLVGSQGTLGITTEITWRLVREHHHEKMLVIFLDDLDNLGDLVTEILKFNPDSVEAYDDESMKLAVKFFGDFFKSMGVWGALKLGVRFLPEAWMMLKRGVPKLVVIAEFVGDDERNLNQKVHLLQDKIRHFGYQTRIPRTDADERKYWKIRHESFNLLRKHVKGMRTAPFIDDFIVNPEHLPEFLPRLQKLLGKYPNMIYTIAGHAGNGNFHIIPLMDLTKPENIPIIDELSDKVYDLVLEYKGSITAEHNDGIIRTPYLEKMYGAGVCALFKRVKEIFDPQNIFNPRKKVGATKEYMMEHISTNNKHT